MHIYIKLATLSVFFRSFDSFYVSLPFLVLCLHFQFTLFKPDFMWGAGLRANLLPST